MALSLAQDAHPLKNGRPTIAVLIGTITSEYHEELLRGAEYIAKQKGYNLIGFSGGAISSRDPFSLTRDSAFDLVNMELIDGVISPFSSHMRFLNEQDSQTFIKNFSSVPIVNIGSELPGMSNIIADYQPALTKLFKHLHDKHGHRRIALLRGPKNHASSNVRMQIYQELLKQHQLDDQEELIIYANFKVEHANKKVKEFLSELKEPIDAIIAVNDNQAFGAINACHEMNLSVPNDIAIAGSMNTLQSSFSNPSLTSVSEPLFELGSCAARELIRLIETKSPPRTISAPTSLMIRESCGCHGLAKGEAYQIKDAAEPQQLPTNPVLKGTQLFFEQVVENYKGGINRAQIRELIHLYEQALQDHKFEAFLAKLQNKLEHTLKSEDISLWLTLIAKLQLASLNYLQHSDNKQALLQFLERLLLLKQEIEQSAIKFQRFETEYYLNYFRSIVNKLNSSFDLSNINSADILELSELYISTYQNLGEKALKAQNVFAVRNKQFSEIDKQEYPANQLIPKTTQPYHERYTLLVLPLSFREQALGFLVLNLSARKGTAFENLRAILSSALKNETLIQDLTNAEARFSDIAHSTSNWLWETDQQHRFIYCSESCTTIIGYDAKHLLGKSIEHFHIQETGRFIDNMDSAEDLISLETWYRHQSGKIVCLLISAKPVFKDGQFQGYRGVFEDITEKKLQQDKIKKLAYSDILTGLPNRAHFQEKLQKMLEPSNRDNKAFCLMLIDLDHFKHINDTLGHAAGDRLLISLARRLKASLRSYDLLARLGGDEFMVILPNTSEESEVISAAQRILSAVKDPFNINDKQKYSTLSLGISLYPHDGKDAQTLLQKADEAMYQAKSRGRNGYVFYDKRLEEKSQARKKYIKIVREALANKQFTVFYQGQVDCQHAQLIGFEALVRINNQQEGLISPLLFIPLAEELGLIKQIDEWVFEQVCRDYQLWGKMGVNSARISVNLSAVQLQQTSTLKKYITIMERYQVPAHLIQLEITENALIKNAQAAQYILQGFKDYGVSIALDDFGTGHSSLNCINLYPIDTIKIDRSFVKDAIDNPKNKALIQGIVLIAQRLNLNIIAEGVENKAQYQFIKEIGCHEIQGFYFYQPAPLDKIQAHFKANKA